MGGVSIAIVIQRRTIRQVKQTPTVLRVIASAVGVFLT
jgi:hypothetical protein